MATFAYTAKDKKGELKKGTLIAADQSSAAANLIDKGLTPILVKEEVAKTASGLNLRLPFGSRIKLVEKVIFSRQFATMINAGVPIVQSLAILEKQTTSRKFKAAIGDTAKKVEGGSTLSAALAAHPDVFSPVYVNMVKAGESGGLLDQVLDRLATQQEKDAEIVGKVRGAMIYPAVITSVTVAAFFFLMVVIVPKLSAIFEGLGGELPIYTKIMLLISSSLINYGLFLLAGLVVMVVLFIRFVRTPSGKRVFDRFLLRLPIFGQIIVKVNIARFARTFGSLMSSGLSVLDALQSTATALNNTVFQDGLKEVAKEVKAGKPISETIAKNEVFPPIVAQMLAVGEETGQLDSILIKLAEFYEKEVDAVIAGLTSIIEPILILVLGGMVGFIVISVFGPLSSLNEAI
ncbi:MAG TPA: type II secretion system F family protein [Candidatus Dormibacteraeota bacterium]|nr:type II secretion system F family protein [Candidatus Dormibacteraeota bacterium]